MGRADNVTAVDEPFNLSYNPRRLSRPFPRWFQYITSENEDLFAERLDDVFALRYPVGQFTGLRSLDQLRRYASQWALSVEGRRHGHRVLCKDPIGIFSAPWLSRRYHAHMVVCIRHPAAFVSSLVRLGWHFDFSNWLRQPLFMRDCAGPYSEQIEEFSAHTAPIHEQAILLWKVIYNQVHQYQASYTDWAFVRHEDISREPLESFARLYSSCGLDFNPAARAFLMETTSRTNPAEVPPDAYKSVRRNSAEASRTWRSRLTPDEVNRVRDATETESSWFYGPRTGPVNRPFGYCQFPNSSIRAQ